MSEYNQHNETASEEQLQPYYDKVYFQADTIARHFILGFFVAGLLLAYFNQTYLLAIIMGGVSVGIFFLMQMFLPGSQLLRYVTSVLFWNFGLQYLIQMQGLYEMHFLYFIALTVLLFYEDWKILLPATIYAVLTLIVIYFFNDADFLKTYLPEAQNASFTSFILHLTLILFYAGLCLRWSMMQRDQTHESAIRAILMERQLNMMSTNIQFADSISQGNYNVDYPSDQTDKLGQSLLNMRASLSESAAREERERFSTSGLARIGEILRQHANTLEILCDKVVEEIVKYMKANQGAIFMIEEKGTTSEHLKLVACRAWDRKKYLQKEVRLGEGLVGQAALERQTIFLTKVPNNYVTISSGLGEANPNCVLIVPLKSENEIVGIIELASFKAFHDYQVSFMEKVGESIASTMVTTQNNQRNKQLLEQSHLLTEQMRAQEEEVRQNLEEMQATQEEMGRKNTEIERLLTEANEKEILLKEKILEVEQIKQADKERSEEMLSYMNKYKQTLLDILDQLPHKVFLKDHEGKMALVNTVVAKAHNMTISELIGKSDFDFVDAETAQDWRNQELEIIKKGSETYIFTENFDGEDKILKSTKMAFFIHHMNEMGLLGIQTDITELQNLKVQLERLKGKS
jgi:methyl-accepting chemotaxis protein